MVEIQATGETLVSSLLFGGLAVPVHGARPHLRNLSRSYVSHPSRVLPWTVRAPSPGTSPCSRRAPKTPIFPGWIRNTPRGRCTPRVPTSTSTRRLVRDVSSLVEGEKRRKGIVRQRGDDHSRRARPGRQIPREVRLFRLSRVLLEFHPLLEESFGGSARSRGEDAGVDRLLFLLAAEIREGDYCRPPRRACFEWGRRGRRARRWRRPRTSPGIRP